MERTIVADSGILCPGCRKVTLLIEEPGSETPRWAHCPNPECNWYIYWVGRVRCTKIADNDLIDEEQAKLKELLGPATLQPWVLEHIQQTRRELGLVEDRACRECGCTEEEACFDEETGEPCHWVEEDLCSVCARKLGSAVTQE